MAKIRVPITTVEECSVLWKAGLLRWDDGENTGTYPGVEHWGAFDTQAEWQAELDEYKTHILVDDDDG